ncbi:MAG: UpxY family transcription antiterminator [Prolixibacteraceae bacterium]|nr:UpxY family transcription antiterminator [Prolixibacteraceae bacterium]NLX28035.1 UpxY family transcription antiterminator [Bacteroidales bacterium]
MVTGIPHKPSTLPDTPQWYAIYVNSRAEKKVEADLAAKGVEVFLPLKMSLRKWSDRKKWVEMPLIPGYCFVRISLKENLRVLQTTHVVGFVRFEGKPARIQDRQIEFLKRMLKQSDYDWEITHEEFMPGQTVEIVAGPFIGLEAELMAIKGKKRVGVRIEQINNTLFVDIPMSDLVVIG